MEAKQHLVLSLFPGIGLLDMAFEDEGFTVVRGPDLLWGGDIHRFHPPTGRFDGVIGGPPCQGFSELRRFVEWRGGELQENLIPEYERCVAAAAPAWFIMEQVPAAPVPVVPGYIVRDAMLNNRWVGAVQDRERRFSFGTRDGRNLNLTADLVALESIDRAPTVCKLSFDRARRRRFPEACRLQGLPDGFDLPPFTVEAKCQAVFNGVPLPMGRAVARAVRRALEDAP